MNPKVLRKNIMQYLELSVEMMLSYNHTKS